MATPVDWKTRLGAFLGWVVLLALLGYGGWYGWRAYTAYDLGKQAGHHRGWRWADNEGHGIPKASIAYSNAVTIPLHEKDHVMKPYKYDSWEGKLYVEGWGEGVNNGIDDHDTGHPEK